MVDGFPSPIDNSSGAIDSSDPRRAVSDGFMITDRRALFQREASIGGGHLIDAKHQAKIFILKSARRLQVDSDLNSVRNRNTSTGSVPVSISEDTPLVSSPAGAKPDGGTERTYDTVSALKEIVLGKNILSALLLVAPLAWYSAKAGWSPAAVFWLNFLVMVPLAAILGDFTEEVALHTNQTIGGLVNATFGNAVEVVVAIQALLQGEIRVVQASMIGSIFSNLLLVLGCCFFFGGLKHSQLPFNATAATANMALLALSSIALVLPTPFASYSNVQDEDVLAISRVAAIFLVVMYVQLLFFQLKTHSYLFDESPGGAAFNGSDPTESKEEDSMDEDEEASVSLSVALIGLLTTTLLVTIFSDFLVSSIDGYSESSGISKTFVGVIVLPIIGNAVEHITAVTVAYKGKMDLALGVAVGSCTQISLFVVPLTVLVGWACDMPMNLNFPHFEIILYVLSVFTVSVCLSNPNSNWLEGSLLVTTYCMIAVGFWFEKVENF